MPVTNREIIETFIGRCKLKLSDRHVRTKCVLRIYQDYNGGIPTLKHADGAFSELPQGDSAFAMMGRDALELELEDGRKCEIFITDLQGPFKLTGPLA
jgi:hypothetical protein